MSDERAPTLDYQRPPDPDRTSLPLQAAAVSSIIGDLALLMAVFLWNGASIWGPYISPPVSIYWAQPTLILSILFGIGGTVVSGIGMVRPASAVWKAVAGVASALYLAGFAVVVSFGLV